MSERTRIARLVSRIVVGLQADIIPPEHSHRKHAPPAKPRDSKVQLPEALPPPPPPPSAKPHPPEVHRKPVAPAVTPAAIAEPRRDTTTALPDAPTPTSNGASKGGSKRPNILGRSTSERAGADGKGSSRRSSWLSNISNKLSNSQSTPDKPAPAAAQSSKAGPNALTTPPVTNNGRASPLPQHPEEVEEAEHHTPAKTKEQSSSFFSNLTRRLSNASTSNMPKAHGTGGMCGRMVLNVDPNRERCLVPEMDPSRLRKVSFCVDVEIAGGPRYSDEDDEQDRTRKRKDAKMKERAEGEALKNPSAMKEEKDGEGENTRSKALAIDNARWHDEDQGDDDCEQSLPGSSPDDDRDHANRKKEKKKKSEEERKLRKEKKRQRAEESGAVPLELSNDNEEDVTAGSSPPPTSNGPTLDTPLPVGLSDQVPQIQGPPVKQDRPTTDPVRIYRRCCQLRETPILKRITEQLMSPTCCMPSEPGVVNCLDLSGSRLQLADVVTLGDWLAVVPVKQLRYEDGDLNDEGVRCILAGLLAAKKPEPTKRKSVNPKHREGIAVRPHQERTGVVEKVTFKNNPRITRLGWKHISLFIYMCRSLKAIDLSMNQFPDTLPSSAHVTPVKSPQRAPKGSGDDTDACDSFFKCLSERLGGSKLEELIVSECELSAHQIRRIVDGAVACGISRLGLAGNHIDDEGLEYVLRYLRSGTCHGLDIGGNDLHGRLDVIADSIKAKQLLPCWGLSLAGCNLSTSDLKALFPALVRLPDFRFLDLSHNRDLCTRDDGTISLFRRYMGQFKYLKRIHLADVGMSPKQAIALADALPDGPRLAHLNILENPMLSALASAKDENSQEEACALYASLMAAVRVSSTLICIDIDVSSKCSLGCGGSQADILQVPSQDNSEVVKALAKQVVAYSLRNMEQFAIAEATGTAIPNATAKLTEPHGGEKQIKEITVPDVLMHLVGHVDGVSVNHDRDDPAPDDDYIVGGTGVVKALQYVLGEKANDLRRTSVPSTPISGSMTPTQRPGSSAGLIEQQQGKAKKMSKNLLGSARKIRMRLQPALVREAQAGDELAYRRLRFLDQTLQNMIQRFEDEYPETREVPPSPRQPTSMDSSLTDASKAYTDLSLNTQGTDFTNNVSDEEDEPGAIKSAIKRHGSGVSLASRALGAEEGRLHRLGQQLRREVIDLPNADAVVDDEPPHAQRSRIRALGEKLESISGGELKSMIERDGWQSALKKVGMNYDDLRGLQEQDPEGWEQFKESQMKARANLDRDRPSSAGGGVL